MKFLVDAQLPRRFCGWLGEAGCDALHTLDLADGNRTRDQTILDISGREDRIVVTKDDDFVQSFFVLGKPKRLLLIATGNIGNDALEVLLRDAMPRLLLYFREYRFIEMTRAELIVHE